MAYSAEFYAKRNALAESLMADGWEEEEAYQYADGEIAKQLSPTQMQASPISAASSTAAPSTAMQIVQRLQTKGIDPSFATTTQLEEARQAVGAPPVPAAQVVAATSGGMAAPVSAPEVNPYTYNAEMGWHDQYGNVADWAEAEAIQKRIDEAAKAASVPEGYTRLGPVMNTPQGIVGDVYKDTDGKFYVEESVPTGVGLQRTVNYRAIPWNAQQVQAELGAQTAAREQMQADENPDYGGGVLSNIIGMTKDLATSGAGQVISLPFAVAGAQNLMNGGGLSNLFNMTQAPAPVADASAAFNTVAGGGGESIINGGALTDLMSPNMSVAPWVTGPNAVEAAEMAAGQFSIAPEYLAANAVTPSWLAPAMAAAATTPTATAVPPAAIPPAAVPGAGAAVAGAPSLSTLASGASLAGTAATLGGGADQVGSDWASLGINPDGTINQDVMNGGLLPTDPNTGLVLPNFQASPSGTGNQALDDFIKSQGGTYDSIAPGTGTASDAPGVPTGLMDGLSNSDLLKLGLPLAGAALGGLSGASQAGTTTTVQDLPDWLKPYVTGNLDAAKAYMAANPQDNSLLDPARAELNKTIAGDYLNSNPANAFYSGAQNYVNPGIAGMQAGASGAYVGQNPGDAGYRAAQNYINPGIAALQSGASGSFMGLNPADAGYRAAQNYTNQGIAALQPGARGDYVGTNPADAYYRQAANFSNSGIDLLRPAATGAYLGLNPSDPYYRNAANYTNTSMDYLRPTAEGKFLNANPYIDALYAKARDAVGTGIDSRFSKAGRYGSGAHQGVLGTTFDNLATDIYGNNYAQERQNMLSAGGTLISADQAQQAARLAGASGLSGNYQNDRATQLAAAGNLGTLEQAQQAARLAGAQGLGTNYANERNLQFNYGQALSSVDAAQQAARLAGTQGLSTNYNTERSLQANYAQNQAAAEQAQQAARLAGTAGLSSNYNQDRTLQYNYGQTMTAAEQAQQAARLAGASGLSSNWNAARNNQLTAATSAPGFTADAATSPFAAFNAFGNLTKGLGVSQTSSPYFTNPVGGALSGALAGYGLSKAFG